MGIIKKFAKKIPSIRKIIDERALYYNTIQELSINLKDIKASTKKLEATYNNTYSKLLEQQNKNELLSLEQAQLTVEREELKEYKLEMDINHKRLVEENNQLTISIIELEKNCSGKIQEIQDLIIVNSTLNKKNMNLESEINRLKSNIVESFNSKEYWEKRYSQGVNSGAGSYSHLAQFKAEVINNFIAENNIIQVIEFGCGDGNQLSLINYKNYTGVDVSQTIINRNKENFINDQTKTFFTTDDKQKYMNQKYDLSISMDVIFHLLEEDVYANYMNDLFNSTEKFVIIYSSNHEEYTKWPEFRNRKFMKYVQENFPEYILRSFIPNKYPYQIGKEEESSASDFYIFEKI